MARIETVTCDECGAVKGAANHWLHMDVLAVPKLNAHAINIGREELENGFQRRDLCGQMCFLRMLGVLLFGETPRGVGAPRPMAVPYPDGHVDPLDKVPQVDDSDFPF